MAEQGCSKIATSMVAPCPAATVQQGSPRDPRPACAHVSTEMKPSLETALAPKHQGCLRGHRGPHRPLLASYLPATTKAAQAEARQPTPTPWVVIPTPWCTVPTPRSGKTGWMGHEALDTSLPKAGSRGPLPDFGGRSPSSRGPPCTPFSGSYLPAWLAKV